jgi:hypothetical protein
VVGRPTPGIVGQQTGIAGESHESYARPDPTLFDVVPVGMVLWPELFTSRPAHVPVTDTGMTDLVEDTPPNCLIGVTVDQVPL